MIRLWLAGLLRHRFARIVGTTLGIALTVALIATLGFFLAGSSASMTARAVAGVPIDWQVEAVSGADPAAIRSAISKAAPDVAVQDAFYAGTDGFQTSTGGTVQTTGPGKVLGLGPGYRAAFPKEIRLLSGSLDGVLIAQQTASNLHVGPGDFVTINRIGLDPATVTVAGVVDLPDADALFQAVGLPKQAAPQAPPDNVLILPTDQWHAVFDPQAAARPDSTRLQLHVRLDHTQLPSQPAAAFLQVASAARNLEARLAGQSLVANNLGARLDAVRGDSLYATVLFLFLGLPGIAIAAAVTAGVAASGADRRRADQALLRIRGATARRILLLGAGEPVLAAATGGALALAAAYAFARFALPGFATGAAVSTGIGALAVGVALAFAVLILPAARSLRRDAVTGTRRSVARVGAAWWQRVWLDLLLLATAGLLFWQTASSGYQIVLAPEGVPATAVDYKAFIAPALFWAGSALFLARLAAWSLARSRGPVRWIAAATSGPLAAVVGRALAHQGQRITLGIAMTALAIAFGTSTAIFNATYAGQARVDAELTNGADVTVFGTAATPVGPHLGALKGLPGIAAAEPMQHRFAYVGTDLQDLYGIDPAKISNVTHLANAFFSGASAQTILDRLARTPNGVLVSEETVKDFQLNQGDLINLRLMNAADRQYHTVPFRFIGVAREFPTAPKDSFLVANAGYVAKMTGNPAAEYLLIRAKSDPAALADAVRSRLSDVPGLQIKDIGAVTHIIGSSLTAVNLSSLTAIELVFAVLMAAASAGLMLALGFNDRRRAFAILAAVGAKPAQLRGFLWAEGGVVFGIGSALGLAVGAVVAWMLVKLLTGVFDPPPEALVIPWVYIAGMLLAVGLSVFAAVRFTHAGARWNATALLREL
ncbi:MAG: FtsX-like permease family protein [Rhodobacteraceae bacterium]|nr:FtsX-like permease family protein [Paracoccaceae bacterium]